MLVGADTSDARLLAAVAAGAFGYVGSDAGFARVSAALLDAASGRSAFPRRLEALLIAGLHGRGS